MKIWTLGIGYFFKLLQKKNNNIVIWVDQFPGSGFDLTIIYSLVISYADLS